MMHTGGYNPNARRSWIKKVLIIVATLVFLGSVGAAGFFFWQYNSLKANPETVSQEKTQRLTEKVSKLYALPDEEPTIAEITDKEKLKDQAFFKNAENGDSLFIFPKAKLAILYREETNKLINVGPIAISSESDGTTPENP